MSDGSDFEMEDSEEYDPSDDGDDEMFETPAVQAKESMFTVLEPEDCEKRAMKEVTSVVDLLCCDPAVAQILLRHFKWDRDKLTDGACRPQHKMTRDAPFCAVARLPFARLRIRVREQPI